MLAGYVRSQCNHSLIWLYFCNAEKVYMFGIRKELFEGGRFNFMACARLKVLYMFGGARGFILRMFQIFISNDEEQIVTWINWDCGKFMRLYTRVKVRRSQGYGENLNAYGETLKSTIDVFLMYWKYFYFDTLLLRGYVQNLCFYNSVATKHKTFTRNHILLYTFAYLKLVSLYFYRVILDEGDLINKSDSNKIQRKELLVYSFNKNVS